MRIVIAIVALIVIVGGVLLYVYGGPSGAPSNPAPASGAPAYTLPPATTAAPRYP